MKESRNTWKVVVCGSRSSTAKELVYSTLFKFNDDIQTIISGMGGNIDAYGIQWANENRKGLLTFPADWETYGNAAGPIRNAEMVKICDMVIAFWDGESRGTKNTIDLALENKKPVYIIPVKKT